MPNMTTDQTSKAILSEIAGRLAVAESILLVTHDRPDGDGLGSMMALAIAARRHGKTCRLACNDPVPRRYAFLVDDELLLDAPAMAAAAGDVDCIAVFDTCAAGQLESVAATLATHRDKLLIVDHHLACERIAGVCWRDSTAAAAGVMIVELLDALGWQLDEAVAEAAMTAICSDTGWLQFSNTDSRAITAVARCIDAGVSPALLHRRLYQNDRPERLALLGVLLSNMRLHCDGRVAMMTVTAEDFARTGAAPDETENLINEPLRIGSVCASALLVERDERIRVSLRSKTTPISPDGDPLDVAEVARRFGGGGHARAAGCRLPGKIDDVAEQILAALTGALGIPAETA